MTLQRLGPADFVHQRWANGRGETTELVAERDAERLVWRVSIADVERPGPFSDFSGYQRTIVLLEGRGMALSFDSGAQIVMDRPLEPFRFDGGWKTFCRLLDGPVRDLNLIADASRVEASLDVVRLVPGTSASLPAAPGTMLLYAAGGSADVATAGGHATLDTGEMLRIDAAAPISPTASSATSGCSLVLIRIAAPSTPHERTAPLAAPV